MTITTILAIEFIVILFGIGSIILLVQRLTTRLNQRMDALAADLASLKNELSQFEKRLALVEERLIARG
jgi:predicted PurR-regulated permease PerM